MTESEYQDQIPVFCRFQTAKEHADYLMLCWAITSGRMKYRGVEGPSQCHMCDVAIRAKRWDRVWYRRFLSGTLQDF